MKSTIEKFGSGMHFIKLPEDCDTSKLDKRVLCKVNSKLTFHCALMHKKEGGYYINIGSKILKTLKLKLGDSIEFELMKDDSEFQFEYPEELREVLETDIDAKKIFDQLTAGNKRGLIYLVTQVKSIDKKIERSLTIAEKLKMGITSPRLVMKKSS